jgi:hypothetical protein
MNHKIYSIASIIVIFLSAHQGAAQITNTADESVDFTKYKSFTFKGWSDDSDPHVSELDRERILDAFDHELTSRNITQDNGTPDIGITLYVVIKDKTRKNAYTHYSGNPAYAKSYGYGGYSDTSYREEYYKEGTIIVNFFDEKEKNLIWEGVLITIVKKKPKKRNKSIPEHIRQLMYTYPIKPVKK